jgi:catechol 2,3-dioxygenase-like lactoylglutathione lyase family enzyme
MGLSDARVQATIAVTDVEKAAAFYEGQLGLRAEAGAEPDGGRTYACGAGTTLHIFPSPHAAASGATVAGFMVDDVEGTVDALIANGVTFEQYAEGPFTTDAKGVARIGDIAGAWVKDPDGNVLGIASA